MLKDFYSKKTLITKPTNPQYNTITFEKPISKTEDNLLMTLTKTIIGRIFLPVIIAAFSTVIMHKFLLSKLIITNPLVLQAVLIIGSLASYFIPQFLLYGFLKSKEHFEKNKIWFEFTYVILAIVAYIIIIVYYTSIHH